MVNIYYRFAVGYFDYYRKLGLVVALKYPGIVSPTLYGE
jgi:hypothetical protein